VIDLLVRGAHPLDGDQAVDLHVDAGQFVAVVPAGTDPPPARETLDAAGALVSPPYVEPHVHLDTCLTAGQPRWNASGTLWEGIACWGERKATLTRADVVARADEVLRWYAANGALHVRSHVDVTDPDLVALDALLELRERVRPVIDLQLVAFPQEGICSFPGGEKLLAEAARRGVDVIGAIPHFEDTREDGVRSVEIAVELAERYGVRVDVHCDEIDDDHSRFIEVLATQAHRRGLGDRVTASHTTAMGSYNAAYSQKLHRIIARSNINMVCNPTVNLHLQGRLDSYPRRRGLTQVKELLGAGINVAFGGDDVMDPWYPLGTANPLQVAHVGAHATQLTAPAEVAECFRMVTERAAAVVGLGDRYGVQAGRPASFLLLPATDRFDAVRRQVAPMHVFSHGRLVASTPPRVTALTWLDGESAKVDFARRGEPGWRAGR
jgi:cytosine/creatinine deaminase